LQVGGRSYNIKMKKKIIILCLLLFGCSNSFSQGVGKLLFSNVNDTTIKFSQLKDTSIKFVAIPIVKEKNIGVEIYYHGVGFTNVLQQTTSLNWPLKSFVNKNVQIGSKITIGGFTIKNKKSNKSITYQGGTYTIVSD
jgi:hypothetical protein